MNKNSKHRRHQALKEYHAKNGGSSEASFEVPVTAKGGGMVKKTVTIKIGFIKPVKPEPKRNLPGAQALAVAEGQDRLAAAKAPKPAKV